MDNFLWGESFGTAQSRKSRVYKRAALIGRRGVKGTAVASLADRDMGYHLVHILRDRTPESIDQVPPDHFGAEEYRMYSVDSLRKLLTAFADGASEDALLAIERAGRKHRAC